MAEGSGQTRPERLSEGRKPTTLLPEPSVRHPGAAGRLLVLGKAVPGSGHALLFPHHLDMPCVCPSPPLPVTLPQHQSFVLRTC